MNSESTVFLDADIVIGNLVDILIEEERLIPDFVVNHKGADDDYLDIYEFGNDTDYSSDITYEVARIEELMKRLMLVVISVGIGVIGFLVGFFSAP